MRRILVLALLLTGALVVSQPAQAGGGFDSLSESFRATLVGGGLASEGVGLATRSGGPERATISISSIPQGATVSRAFLYWSILGGEDPLVSFGGQAVAGSLIGRSPDPCWFNVNDHDPNHDTRSYRADVTSLVPGNGAYEISGVGGTFGLSGDGTGASLIVVFEQPSANFQATVVINDGSMTGGRPGPHRSVMSHFFAGVPSTGVLGASLHVGVGEGQAQFDDGAMTLGSTEVLGANGFDGSDGHSWDDETLAVAPGVFGPQQLTNSIGLGSDCLVWTYAGLAIRRDRVGPLPSITITAPADGSVLSSQTVTISGVSTATTSVRLSEGTQELSLVGVDGQGAWSSQIYLQSGAHSVSATALDAEGIPVASDSVQFSIETSGPPQGPVRIVEPANDSVLGSTGVTFSGTVSGAAAVRLHENGTDLGIVPVDNGSWSLSGVTLAPGRHFVFASPIDAEGREYGPWSWVGFGIDVAPPEISLHEADFPNPPVGPFMLHIGSYDERGFASDDLAVARVVVRYRSLAPDSEVHETEANCSGCQPTYCANCWSGPTDWWAHLERIDGPGVYEIQAVAFDLAGRSSSSEQRIVVVPFGGDFPIDGPPNCMGPLEDTPACFDPFEGEGPFENFPLDDLFGPDSPLCFGPIKDMFCSQGEEGRFGGRR